MIFPTQANRKKNELELQITEDSMFSKHLRIFLVTSIEAYERGNFETRNETNMRVMLNGDLLQRAGESAGSLVSRTAPSRGPSDCPANRYRL